jgi:pyruvate kinase
MRLTKIIATLGPASGSEEILRAMIAAGLDVARLNFSHGTPDDHLVMLEKVRRISAEEKRHVAILQDLCGPKIRLGKVKGGKVELKEGAKVTRRPSTPPTRKSLTTSPSANPSSSTTALSNSAPRPRSRTNSSARSSSAA